MKAKISLVWICLDSESKKDPETPVDELQEGGEGRILGWRLNGPRLGRELLKAAGGLLTLQSALGSNNSPS